MGALPCRMVFDPPRDGIIRTSPGPEGSKDKVALPGARGIAIPPAAVESLLLVAGKREFVTEGNNVAVALYRRYRPDNFDDLVGQDHVTVLLKNALDAGHSSHAYLFSGPRGCGKTTSARILARCLNCANGPTATPCGTCDSCVDLAAGGPGSLDVIEIDAASHNGVDDARELRERASFAPARDRFKIFILDEAHMVTSAGFNALLKIVEEPPEHVKFIFATTEPEKVIGTIRSRTHHYPFRLVSPQVLLPYLQQLCESEGIVAEPGVLDLVIRAGGGSVRDSLSVLDQLIAGAGPGGLSLPQAVGLLGYTDTAILEDMVDALGKQDGFRAFQIIDTAATMGVDATQFTKDLLQMLRDVLICGLIPQQAADVLPHVPEDQLQRMLEQASAWGTRRLSRSADQLDETLRTMSGTASPKLQLELLLGRLLAADSQPEQQVPVSPPVAAPVAAAPAPVATPRATPPAPEPAPAAAPVAPPAAEPRKAPAPQQPRPAAAPTQVAPASAGADQLNEKWQKVMASVDRQSRVSGVVAKGTSPVEVSGGALKLFPENAVRARLGAGSAALNHIAAAVAEVFGPNLRVEIVDSNQPAASPPPAAPASITPAETHVTPEPSPAPEPVKETPQSTPWEAPAPPPQTEPDPITEEADLPAWDDEVSSDDETVKQAPGRGLPALLDVLGGTVIDDESEGL